MGRSNYLGMAGYHPSNHLYDGLFTYNSRNSLARVPDGTSNTILFGEYAGGSNSWTQSDGTQSGGIPNGLMGAAWSCGFNYSGFGGPTTTGIDDVNQSAWAFFSSRHTNVVNFAFADGSVRQISPTIDFTVWVYLTAYKDGHVVTLD
jgi:prepilin-type processing-associated H-X9-DG protein